MHFTRCVFEALLRDGSVEPKWMPAAEQAGSDHER